MTFGTRLHTAIADRGPFCVGVDPHAELLHAWDLIDDVASLETFALTVVEAVAPYVSVVKPQSAFFERFGSAGIAVLERVVREARAAGALVLLDVKRGDIGSTSQAYADAYLDQTSPLAVDAITASPFLGFGSIAPMIDRRAQARRRGVRAGVTSNKEGVEVQGATTSDGTTVGGRMIEHLRELNAEAVPLGSFGAVIGATIPDPGIDLDFNGPILAPGYGAQGGTAGDIGRIFGAAAAHVVPSPSRDALRLGLDRGAMRDAVARANDELRALTG